MTEPNPAIEKMVEPLARALANAVGVTYADTANWQKYAEPARKLLHEFRIWPRTVIQGDAKPINGGM